MAQGPRVHEVRILREAETLGDGKGSDPIHDRSDRSRRRPLQGYGVRRGGDKGTLDRPETYHNQHGCRSGCKERYNSSGREDDRIREEKSKEGVEGIQLRSGRGVPLRIRVERGRYRASRRLAISPLERPPSQRVHPHHNRPSLHRLLHKREARGSEVGC